MSDLTLSAGTHLFLFFFSDASLLLKHLTYFSFIFFVLFPDPFLHLLHRYHSSVYGVADPDDASSLRIRVPVAVKLDPSHLLSEAGSAYRSVRHFKARSFLKSGISTQFSVTSEKWTTTDDCNDGYLQTHTRNNLSRPLLSLSDLYCVVCPAGGACNGDVTFRGVLAREGYARVSWNRSVFVPCMFPEACLGVLNAAGGGSRKVWPVPSLRTTAERASFEEEGGQANIEACQAGHSNVTSEICDDCEAGHYKPLGGRTCEPCPDGGSNALMTVLSAVLAVLYAAFMIADSLEGTTRIVNQDVSMPFHTIAIRIVASYMQVTSLLNQFELKLDDSDVSRGTIE